MASQNWARSYMPDPTLYILFSSIFPKKAWAILWKLTWITSLLLVSYFQTRLPSSTDVLDNIIKPDWIRFSSGWLCQVLAKRIQSGSKPMRKNHPACFWSVLPSWSGPDANLIWHVYWEMMMTMMLMITSIELHSLLSGRLTVLLWHVILNEPDSKSKL